MSLEDRRDCSYAAANQEIARIADYHQKLERGKEGFYPVSEGSWPCWHLDCRCMGFKL